MQVRDNVIIKYQLIAEQSKLPCYKALRGIYAFERFFLLYMALRGKSLGR